jgi:uncharacterized membrane protein YidH (DUF202 family)
LACFNRWRITRFEAVGVKAWVSHYRGASMNSIKLVGVVLIVLGALGLVYGGFSYTKDTTALKVGPLEMTVQEKKTVNVPLWAGIGAIVVGGVLLVMGGKKG